MKKLTIAIACGGTGGHTFPGLATGRALRARGHKVIVLQAGRAIEAKTLAGWDGPTFKTGARSPLPKHPIATLRSVIRTWGWFRRERPDVVLAMGSYASFAPGWVAHLRHVPLVLHEANAVPGKAVALLSRWASAVAVSFPGTKLEPRKCRRIVHTGLPVRTELLDQAVPVGFEEKSDNGFTVFVTGGSQGAHAVNEFASKVLSGLSRSGRIKGLRIIHQTGAADEKIVRKRYADAGADAAVFDFLKEMGGAMKAADFAIARSGAATCAEFCLFGLPSLLIPLPIAVRDHQYLNAKYLSDAGAAMVVRQDKLSEESFGRFLVELAGNREKLRQMRECSKSLAVADAAERLADLVERQANLK